MWPPRLGGALRDQVNRAFERSTLLNNAIESRANKDSWTFKVYVAEVRRAPATWSEPLAEGESIDTVEDPELGTMVVRCWSDARALLASHGGAAITNLGEWRAKFSSAQQWTFVFYHAFVLLEADSDLVICTEKYNDKLELIFGTAEVARAFATRRRATCDQRRPSLEHERVDLERLVTVKDLLGWICGPLAVVWRPYCLVSSNCQHYARDLQQFLTGATKEELAGDREVVLSAVSCAGRKLQYAAEELRDERAVALSAVRQDGSALQFVSPRLRADRQVVLEAVRHCGAALQYAASHIKVQEDIALAAVCHDGRALRFLSSSQRSRPAFVAAAATQATRTVATAALEDASTSPRSPGSRPLPGELGGWALLLEDGGDEAGGELHSDPAFMLNVVAQEWRALRFAAAELRKDRNFMLAVVRAEGMALQFATGDIAACPQVALAAVRHTGLALEFVAEELRSSVEVVRAACMQNGMALAFAADAPRGSRKVVRAAVIQYGAALQFASPELKQDWVLVSTAARRCLPFSSWDSFFENAAIRSDPDIVLTVVRQDAQALSLAAVELRGNREIILAAVERQGSALQLATEALRADADVVRAAVRQDGSSLEFADRVLQGCKELVLEAVRRAGFALRFASLELRADREVVMAALTQDGSALQFAAAELKRDPDLALCAARCGAWWFADWAALFSTPGLAGDRDAAVGAVTRDPQALACLPEVLRHDMAVVHAAEKAIALTSGRSLLTSLRALRLASIGLRAGRKEALALCDMQTLSEQRLGGLVEALSRTMFPCLLEQRLVEVANGSEPAQVLALTGGTDSETSEPERCTHSGTTGMMVMEVAAGSEAQQLLALTDVAIEASPS